jgi:hypothetical protein
MKLNSILSTAVDPIISEKLHVLFQSLALILAKTVYNGYLLANLHVLRCIKEDQPIPDINSGFFKSCMILNTKSTDMTSKKDDLFETLALHFSDLSPVGQELLQNDNLNLPLPRTTSSGTFYPFFDATLLRSTV